MQGKATGLAAADFDTIPEFQTGDIAAKERVWKRTGRLVRRMHEKGIASWTTYAVAEVMTPNGARQLWIASAGAKSDPQRSFVNEAAGEHRVTDKVPTADKRAKLNDAERKILREAAAKKTTIPAVGASRKVCDTCVKSYSAIGGLNGLVTPLETPIKEHRP